MVSYILSTDWTATDSKRRSDTCAHIGLGDEADAAHDAAGKMAAVVLDAGWDGAWFRRAYDAGGEPVGSCQNEEGQIYIEPQGF